MGGGEGAFVSPTVFLLLGVLRNRLEKHKAGHWKAIGRILATFLKVFAIFLKAFSMFLKVFTIFLKVFTISLKVIE